jgi:amino acid transporter
MADDMRGGAPLQDVATAVAPAGIGGSHRDARAGGKLRPNSVTLLGALAMSCAFMGPAVSVYYNIVPAARLGGRAFPLSFVASMIACLLIGASVIQLSRKLQGASFAFTYTREGLGPRAGFMAGWIALLAYAMISPITYAGFGIIASTFLQRQFGLDVSWWYFFLGIGAVVSVLSYFGVNHSTRATLIFLVLEMTVMLALFGSVAFGGAPNTWKAFEPSPGAGRIAFISAGMVFGILSFTGFEAAANLGEETAEARRTIPIAISIAIVLIGLFYLFGSYVADIAFGLDARAIADNPAPFDTIARRTWGNAWAWALDITVLNSVFANAVAGQASIVRNLYALGRARILPAFLGRANRYGVPHNAIMFDYLLAVVLGLGVGAWLGAWGVWNLGGTIMSIGLILVYALVATAAPFFYYRHHRAEFSRLKHVLVPTLGVACLFAPLLGSIYPMPKFPFNLAPYVVGLWIAVGAVYLTVTRGMRALAPSLGSGGT